MAILWIVIRALFRESVHAVQMLSFEEADSIFTIQFWGVDALFRNKLFQKRSFEEASFERSLQSKRTQSGVFCNATTAPTLCLKKFWNKVLSNYKFFKQKTTKTKSSEKSLPQLKKVLKITKFSIYNSTTQI